MTDTDEVTRRTIEVGGRSVVVDEAEKLPWVRSPGDVLRVLVSALGVLLALALFAFADNTMLGLQQDVTDAHE